MYVSLSWASAWLVAVSFMAVAVATWDKVQATRRGRRVPERLLWFVSLLGGSVATYVTMLVIRHKTLHRHFMWGLPLLAVVQTALIYLLCYQNFLIFI